MKPQNGSAMGSIVMSMFRDPDFNRKVKKSASSECPDIHLSCAK